MYVRDAKNRDEAWLLDRIESMGLDDVAFRSRDYVIAVDERTNDRAGFGRLRIHRTDEGEVCELTGIGVLEGWRDQGVGAHVVERLVEEAGDAGFETVHSLTDQPGYLSQFGFRPVETDRLPAVLRERLSEIRETGATEAVGTRLAIDRFRMPDRLREAFKTASPRETGESGGDETAEDFGIDPDEATYKYDTGR
jgi:N-acetylglutamate synthase-like GNAT family acetyltransferase